MAIAFFYTWTTYGTWLPGDRRGWFAPGRGWRQPDPKREREAGLPMTEEALVLKESQRGIVEKTIVDHCQIRKWTLHAANCRTNHVHVVVTADRDIEEVRKQFKAWCTRKLNESSKVTRENWWTERGWDEYLDDEISLASAIAYVVDGQ